MKIKRIMPDTANAILENKKPIGLFYSRITKNSYIAIDNSKGEAKTAEFKMSSDCKHWLEGRFTDDK